MIGRFGLHRRRPGVVQGRAHFIPKDDVLVRLFQVHIGIPRGGQKLCAGPGSVEPLEGRREISKINLAGTLKRMRDISSGGPVRKNRRGEPSPTARLGATAFLERYEPVRRDPERFQAGPPIMLQRRWLIRSGATLQDH
jgi:hypothetical protein